MISAKGLYKAEYVQTIDEFGEVQNNFKTYSPGSMSMIIGN